MRLNAFVLMCSYFPLFRHSYCWSLSSKCVCVCVWVNLIENNNDDDDGDDDDYNVENNDEEDNVGKENVRMISTCDWCLG